MRAFVVVLFALVCGVATTAPQGQHAQMTGLVTDPDGAVIPRTEITVHWDSSGSKTGITSNVGIKQDLHLQTNDLGRFSAEIAPGFYDIFVSSVGFSPACRKIRLRKAGSAELGFTLKLDPLVVAEMPPVVVESKPK